MEVRSLYIGSLTFIGWVAVCENRVYFMGVVRGTAGFGMDAVGATHIYFCMVICIDPRYGHCSPKGCLCISE